MSNPKVSIISANFNKASFISEMVESVFSQKYSNWELIIVDDCSSDSSVQIIKEFCQRDNRIKIHVNEANKGGNYCRNKGLEISQGDFVMFLDSDDLIENHCLENRLRIASGSPTFNAWVFPMGVFRMRIGDCDPAMYWNLTSVDYLGDFLNHKLPWAICQPLWESSFVKRLNGFDLNFVRLQDVELHTRALLEGGKFYLGDCLSPDCFYRIDDTRNDLKQFDFLSNFCKGTIQYYNKFYSLVSDPQKRMLIGTLIETLSNICYQRRKNSISTNDFNVLTSRIIDTCQISKQKRILKFYVYVERKLPIHPKGLKKLILLLS